MSTPIVAPEPAGYYDRIDDAKLEIHVAALAVSIVYRSLVNRGRIAGIEEQLREKLNDLVRRFEDLEAVRDGGPP